VGCVSHVLSLKVWSQEDWLHTVRPVTNRLASCKEECPSRLRWKRRWWKNRGCPQRRGISAQWSSALGRCDEDHVVAWRSRERSVEVGCLAVVESRCPSDDGWSTVLFALNPPRFILVGAARLHPPGRAVAATLRVHWLGGWPAIFALGINA
jgi:hypothetical protein